MGNGNFRDLGPLLNPKSIAVLGASERHGSAGRLVIENLLQLHYPGQIYPVNPKSSQVLGLKCYPDLDALPETVDMVAMLLGADYVLPTLQKMHALGIPAAWSLASGFAESGPDGKLRQAEVTAYAQETGLLLCGPNCVGVANLVDCSATYSVALRPDIQAGEVSVVMQSGAVLMGLANSANFGFRYLISSGNEAALDSADYIGYLASDSKTRVILAFLEGIRDADKFVAACRLARAAGKPVLALKVGRSETAQRTVQAHTGSLAGSDTVLEAVFQREGVIRLNTLDEMVEAAKLFLTCPVPNGDGIGLLSLSGGQIGLLADLAQNMRFNFPTFSPNTQSQLREILPPFTGITNPLDAWGTGDLEKMYPACVAAVSEDPSVQLIAMSRDTPPAVAPREVEQSIRVAQAAIQAKEKTGKPVLVFSNFSGGVHPEVETLLSQNGIPYLQGTNETLAAVQAFEQYATFLQQPQDPSPAGCPSPENLADWRERLSQTDRPLDEFEGRRLLADYQIPGPIEQKAADEDSAARAAADIGYPVVVKIVSADIQHKTEAGGVRIGVADESALRSAYREVMAAARLYKPDARLEGVLVQEMIPPGSVEVIVGIIRDANFGPVIVFGSGGILVELVKDSVVQLPPFRRTAAQGMIQKIRGKKLLDGFRGAPPADIDALADALVRVSQLAVDLGDQIAAMDINPLMVLPVGRGVRAVDVLIDLNKNLVK